MDFTISGPKTNRFPIKPVYKRKTTSLQQWYIKDNLLNLTHCTWSYSRSNHKWTTFLKSCILLNGIFFVPLIFFQASFLLKLLLPLIQWVHEPEPKSDTISRDYTLKHFYLSMVPLSALAHGVGHSFLWLIVLDHLVAILMADAVVWITLLSFVVVEE